MSEDRREQAPPCAAGRAAVGFIFALALMNVALVRHHDPDPAQPHQAVHRRRHRRGRRTGTWSSRPSGALMQFFCGPILGLLSDRFGRRPVLLISLFGLAVDFLFMAFAPTLWWLFVGRLLNGFTAASFSTANAYIADVTAAARSGPRRSAGWARPSAFGFIFGPAIGGFLGEIDLRLPFLAAAALTFAQLALRPLRAAGDRCRPRTARRPSTGRRPIRWAR